MTIFFFTDKEFKGRSIKVELAQKKVFPGGRGRGRGGMDRGRGGGRGGGGPPMGGPSRQGDWKCPKE